ncbi:hypothetical protein, conserved [Plasmodium gonderi]|uniref:Uncharacterized protein n=1 Tax=Plasmodium gonderi TaxID=77519 RepID=A0A1Y1JTU3_PLAGO|nr:hypothetical protein, conserved [Plasmodium gonderi]GAW83324.1 hypothetical protein, conserved [Plasmodium gonderi]
MIDNHHNHDEKCSLENSEENKKKLTIPKKKESILCLPKSDKRTFDFSRIINDDNNCEHLQERREDFLEEEHSLFGNPSNMHYKEVHSNCSKQKLEKRKTDVVKKYLQNDDKKKVYDENGSQKNNQKEDKNNEYNEHTIFQETIGSPRVREIVHIEKCISSIEQRKKKDATEGVEMGKEVKEEVLCEKQNEKRIGTNCEKNPGGDVVCEVQIEAEDVMLMEEEEDYLQVETEDGSLSGTLYGSINGSQNGVQNECTDEKKNEKFETVVPNEELINITRLYHTGINKIETIIALYRYYKNNFNQRFREQMNKYNPLIYLYSNNDFENHISVDCISYNDKINAIKKERLSRLVLYIEDINKIKQALKVKQLKELELEHDEKKERFYDANEDIEDFFIFDNAISFINNDGETTFSECENSSFFKDDASIDNFLDENKNKSNDEFNMLNLFNRFSLKNCYMFNINKNLCAIYARTPMIIKKFAEKINSYSNNTEKNDTELNGTKQDDLNFPLEHKNKENYKYYSAATAREHNQNLDAYIQFHCEKWQENMYDIVEVNSLEFDFNRLRCNIM